MLLKLIADRLWFLWGYRLLTSTFTTLQLRGWRQFGSIDLKFHPHLTVLTGANGTGKSTILKLLAGQLAHPWRCKFAATAVKTDKRIEYSSDARDQYHGANLPGAERRTGSFISIGSIGHLDSFVLLAVPRVPNNQYEVARPEISKQGKMTRIYGLYLPSHRTNANYAHIAMVPTQPYSPQLAFSESVNAVRLSSDDLEIADQKNPHLQRKLALISMHAFPSATLISGITGSDIIGSFESALLKMLPGDLLFKRLDFRGPELVLETERGDFALDSLSGGLESIVDLVWQCVLLSAFAKEFVIILDEPENHLHPEMQRSLLPNFVESFPTAQLVVATHSPLIATSIEDSNLYFFDYDDVGFVHARLAGDQPKTGTSDEALRAFFGITSSMPLWVQERLAEISRRYAKKDLTDNVLNELRREMEGLNLDEYVPQTIIDFVDSKKNNRKKPDDQSS